ncbi:MAG TPA: DUF1648 domain-containing protein [Anaerolineae bacterium]|nr:DUF1648 domain-containing protein [Anaerolineae bacterium]
MMIGKLRLGAIATWVIGPDRLVHVLLALGILLNLVLFACIGWRYRALPGFLPLHFDILGQPDRLGVRGEIFKLPAIGLLLLALNSLFGLTIHRREKPGTYLLLGVTVVVQVLFWLAVLNIMR